MNNTIKRVVSVSCLMTMLVLCKINGNDFETDKNNNQLIMIDDNYSLESIYLQLHMDKNTINYDSTKKISALVQEFLGNQKYYYNGVEEIVGSYITYIYNQDEDMIRLSYHKDEDFLVLEYKKDNIRYNIMTMDENNIHTAYTASDTNDNFYTIDYNNSFEISRSVFYEVDDQVFSISIYNDYDGYGLFFCGDNHNAEKIDITAEEYITLLSTMSKYNNGLNLDAFLKEENLKIYVEKLAIINPELYLELLKYDKSKVLKLNIV